MAQDDGFEPLDGGCACGHVRYRLTSAPINTHGCHCRFCQRMSGAAFSVNAMIEADRVVMLGDGAPETVHTPSALPALPGGAMDPPRHGRRGHRPGECRHAGSGRADQPRRPLLHRH